MPNTEFLRMRKTFVILVFFTCTRVLAQQPFLPLHALLEKEDYVTCNRILDSCEKTNYQPDSVLFYKGLVAVKSGKLENCRELCRKLAEKYPAFGEVHYIKGLLYFSEEKYARSADEFSKAIRVNPGDIRALFDRALALGMMEDYKDAISDLGTCIKLNPAFAKGYYSRAYWNEFVNDFSSAARDYEETVKLEPDNFDAYFGLAYAYKMLKDETKACDAINRAIQHGSQIAVDLKANFCR